VDPSIGLGGKQMTSLGLLCKAEQNTCTGQEVYLREEKLCPFSPCSFKGRDVPSYSEEATLRRKTKPEESNRRSRGMYARRAMHAGLTAMLDGVSFIWCGVDAAAERANDEGQRGSDGRQAESTLCLQPLAETVWASD
jgi:hypothetical protein